MREIKEPVSLRLDQNTPLEELRRYVGATVRQVDTSDPGWEGKTFTLHTVSDPDDDEGDILLSGDGGQWWLTYEDCVIVVQDPPQATETLTSPRQKPRHLA